MRVVEGGCSCGAVRFRLQGEVRFVAICHCDNCRRAHGAGGVEWAGYQEEQLEMLAGDSAGALEGPALRSWETPTAARRSFCGQCGSPLFFRSPRWAGEVHVAVAALDGDPGQAPGARVYADRPPAWLPVPEDGLPRRGGEDGVSPL
ncbi:MAG: hypothetical protein CMJ94_14845 [Planctomycetes bacterium]|nr:hypothetical protein [Planctomycetota bacterium]